MTIIILHIIKASLALTCFCCLSSFCCAPPRTVWIHVFG